MEIIKNDKTYDVVIVGSGAGGEEASQLLNKKP